MIGRPIIRAHNKVGDIEVKVSSMFYNYVYMISVLIEQPVHCQYGNNCELGIAQQHSHISGTMLERLVYSSSCLNIAVKKPLIKNNR